ncbi:MAG: reverse transcriptase N-terminal domain-containing protein, partial [Trichodesmium sp. St5_bin2_1]|nr:reverse transcriptase N-terminal domain-containing protein [Trichodesmium sp. St5_bin2_1]
MNKAKTLKRKLGNPKLFLRVAWDTDDIPTEVCVNPYLQWKDIDWEWVEKNVFKLQKLIYKASSCGDVPMMRKYQKLLTKSYYARLLAVRCMIQENQGKKTAGIDGIKNLPLMQIFNLVNLLKSPYLKASRNYRVWTPKSAKGQKRSLGIPTIYYRALQALMELGMEPEWEARFEPNSYGFRPGRSTYDAIQAIYDSIKQKPKYVLDADISECMKRINHNALLGKLGRTPYRRLIKQWLKSGVFDNNQIRLTRERLGILQGEVISSLLANIALHGMEERINQLAKTLDARRKDSTQVSWQNQVKSLKLIPYADEFVVLHEDIKVVLQVKTVIQEWL